MRIVFVCAHLQHCFLDHSHSSENDLQARFKN